jgi:hypothetical protein
MSCTPYQLGTIDTMEFTDFGSLCKLSSSLQNACTPRAKGILFVCVHAQPWSACKAQ